MGFKIGDKVIIVNAEDGNYGRKGIFENGDIGIIKDDAESDMPLVEYEDGHDSWYVAEEYLSPYVETYGELY